MENQTMPDIANNVTVLHQPHHDVVYDEMRGEIVSIRPASGGRRSAVPIWRHANLQLTLKCNLACSYCRTSSSPKVGTAGELTTDEWIHLFERLTNYGVHSVFVTGGEIFTRPDIWEILAALEQRFVTHILTNGHALAEGLTEYQWQIVSRLKSIQVSLDSATAELHDRFRGKGSWDKAVRALLAIREFGVETIISTVVTPFHDSEIAALARLASGLNSQLLLRPLQPQGRGARLGCRVEEIEKVYASAKLEPYWRGFLAYSEELYPFGIKCEDAPFCGAVSIGPSGRFKSVLDCESSIVRIPI